MRDLKRLDGKPYETVWGGTSLDLTNPKVKAHLIELAKTLHGWGFNYFKMDGLWTGSVTEQIYVNDGYKDDNIGNHQPVPLLRFIEVLEQTLGVKAEKRLLPLQPGDVPATYADVEDLTRDVGFKPSTSIETGIARFVQWYREYYEV